MKSLLWFVIHLKPIACRFGPQAVLKTHRADLPT